MNHLLQSFIFCVLLIFGWSPTSIAQETENSDDYDYVDPELTTKKPKSSGVSLPIRSQSPMNTPVPRQSFEQEPQVTTNEEADPEQKKSSVNKTSVGVEMGSSVSSDFQGNTAINTYVAPQIRHQLSDDVTLTAGVLVSKTFLNGWTNYSFEGGSVPSSMLNTAIFGRLDYRLNDRTTVYGAVYKSMYTMPNGTNYSGSLDGTGFAAGLTYKVNDRSWLQIEVQHNNGYNPFSSYSNYGMGMGGYGMGCRPPFSYFP